MLTKQQMWDIAVSVLGLDDVGWNHKQIPTLNDAEDVEALYEALKEGERRQALYDSLTFEPSKKALESFL